MSHVNRIGSLLLTQNVRVKKRFSIGRSFVNRRRAPSVRPSVPNLGRPIDSRDRRFGARSDKADGEGKGNGRRRPNFPLSRCNPLKQFTTHHLLAQFSELVLTVHLVWQPRSSRDHLSTPKHPSNFVLEGSGFRKSSI